MSDWRTPLIILVSLGVGGFAFLAATFATALLLDRIWH